MEILHNSGYHRPIGEKVNVELWPAREEEGLEGIEGIEGLDRDKEIDIIELKPSKQPGNK